MQDRYCTSEVYAHASPGNATFCHWDFSRIPAAEYEPFFIGLPNVVYKKVQDVRFSVDLLRMIRSSTASISDSDRHLCSQSIAGQVHRYSRRLVKILTKTLPRTKLLVSLKIDGLDLTREQVAQVLTAVTQSKTLETVGFANVPVPSAAVSRFLDAGSAYRLRQIAFVHCDLRADVATNAIQFIQAAPREFRGRTWALTALDLSENDVDGQVQSQIDLLLQERLDGGFTKSREVDVSTITEEEEDAVQAIAPAVSFGSRADLVKPSVLTGNAFVDNGLLRKEMRLVLEALRAVPVAEDVYLIGPDASADAKVIEQCEQLAQELELSE
jgi:hypothetical protein